MLALWRGNAPFGGDALSAFGPWREFSRQSLRGGVLPLWNPHLFCGMSFLANGQSALLYPFSAIYLLLPTYPAQFIDVYFHNLLLACGAYLLARSLGLSRLSAFLAASLIALGGGVSARVYGGHFTWHAVRAWIPWLLWATLLFCKFGSKKHGALAALFVTFILAAGHPLVAALGFALTLGLIAALLIARQVRFSLHWALILLLLALTIGAVSWLPLQEASQFGVRSKGLPYSFAVIGSGSWRTLVRLLLPDFFGGNGKLQWSMSYFPLEEAASLGLVPFFLALLAPVLARLPRRDGSPSSLYLPRAVTWLWSAMLIAFVLALGNNTPVYRLAFEHLPLFRSLRIPVRWLELWFFCAALLSGFSLEGCRQRLRVANDKRDAISLLLILLAIAAVFCLALESWLMSQAPDSSLWMTTAQWNAQRLPQAALEAASQLRWTAVFSALSGFLIAALAAFLVWRWQSAPNAKKGVIERAFCTLMIAELLILFWRHATPAELEQVQSTIQWPPEIASAYKLGERWDTSFRGPWGEYAWNGGMPHSIDIFNGYDPFSPRRFFDFAGAMEGIKFVAYQYQPTRRTALLRVAGVTHTLSAPDTGDGTTPPPSCEFETPKRETTVEAWSLWRYRGAWPRAYLTDNVIRAPEGQQLELLAKLAANDFDLQRHPVVTSPNAFQGIEPHAPTTQRIMPGEITHWSRTVNSVSLDMTLHKSAVLVYSENNYPGWKAYITSPKPRPAPIEFANYLFRGIEVPTDTQHVTLVYESQTFRLALFLSLLGIGFLTALAINLIKNRIGDNPHARRNSSECQNSDRGRRNRPHQPPDRNPAG